MANEFFGKFAEVVAAENAAPEASQEAETSAAPAQETAIETPAAAPAQSGGGISPVVWVGGLIIAVVIVLGILV
jgi:uncharacterized membrane protein